MKLDAQMIESLEIIWNYMVLNMKIEKSDLIIGCGCKDLEIPKKCSELLKQGYDKYIFTKDEIQNLIDKNGIIE